MTVTTLDWAEYFKILEINPPKITMLDPDQSVSSNFWENLYQAFKARMEDEKSAN